MIGFPNLIKDKALVAASSAKESVTYVIITYKKQTILQPVKPEKDIQSSRTLNVHLTMLFT